MLNLENLTLTNLESIEELKENVDEIYLLTNATFVFLMQCGFACLEAGSIRSKNVTNILMKNALDISISCFAYWLIGYATAYGDGNSFIGLTFWAGIGIPRNKFAHWFFQFVFAATAATIVSGAVAERCHFVGYLVYSALISGFVYPVVSHWVWAKNGWLSDMGYSDFAGSGAVHLLGGTCSLAAAFLVGPRVGRFQGREMPGHSTPLIGLGGMMLITGFLAFNGGSLGNMTSKNAGDTIAVVFANTATAGAGGALCGLLAAKIGMAGPKVWNFSVTLNATLTGMVAVCAAADGLVPWSSFVVGTISGGPVYVGVRRLVTFCKIDDPLDAIAVHLGGGFWGLASAPIFMENGIIYGPNGDNSMILLYNMIGGFAIFGWSLLNCGMMFGILKWMNCLRVTEQEELLGLDVTKHNEPAYPEFVSNFQDYSKEFRHTGERGKLHRMDYDNHAFHSDYL